MTKCWTCFSRKLVDAAPTIIGVIAAILQVGQMLLSGDDETTKRKKR